MPKAASERPLGDLDDEVVEDVYQKVANAEGQLKSALDELDGDGGDIRDKLAEAYGASGFSKTALEGERRIRNEGER